MFEDTIDTIDTIQGETIFNEWRSDWRRLKEIQRQESPVSVSVNHLLDLLTGETVDNEFEQFMEMKGMGFPGDSLPYPKTTKEELDAELDEMEFENVISPLSPLEYYSYVNQAYIKQFEA